MSLSTSYPIQGSAGAGLPEPDERSLAVSRRLTGRIRRELEAGGGWLSFERFMHRALYDPELGYYHNATPKFGARGDFITAPELSSVFAQVLATVARRVLADLDDPVILEMGAGSGRLTRDLAAALHGQAVSPCFWILEPSAELRRRQREYLAESGVKVRWLEELPAEPFRGLVMANEVLDAFPAACFLKRGAETRPLGVAWTADGFAWAEGSADAGLSAAVADLETRLGQPLGDGYRSEISPQRQAWVQTLAGCLEAGVILAVDYGLTAREYYHPQRTGGTLMCHYRHRAHGDPFLWPGLQDISTWVDFSACARAAEEAGLSVAGFTTQGQFLIHAGAAEMLARGAGSGLEAAGALKTLVLPGEMGERFKVLVLSRGIELQPLPGRDLRDRL